MATPDHCRKALPRTWPGMPPTQVECPSCYSLWIWEMGQWRQIPWADRVKLPGGEMVGL